MLDLSRLSPEQRRAVLARDGPLLIVAGPGSGKTTVLAARIVYLMTCRQVSPTSILAITFTTKAKRELRIRLGALLGAQSVKVDVTTFHAFGLRIIRQWSEDLGFRPGPLTVYSRDEALAVLHELLDTLGFELGKQPLRELAADIERYRLGGDIPRVADDRIEALVEAYENVLHRRGVVDYPAMLALPLRLFAARPDILRLYQDSYRQILVDEFQDVCSVQYRMLRALAERHRNLTVVGDPRQTVFGWRGADVRFLLNFQQDFPEAEVMCLDRNFRSTGQIVEVANALARSLPWSRPLWTDNPPGTMVHLHIATDERNEAAFVVREIKRLWDEQIIDQLGEVAILYRTNGQAHELSLALREGRLPYGVLGSGDLFARGVVQDAIAYLRLAHNPADASALTRIVNVPPRRLGRLVKALQIQPMPLAELLALAQRYGPAAVTGAERLTTIIDDLHAHSVHLTVASLLDRALDQSGYWAWLAGHSDRAARLNELAMLCTLAERAEGDLATWLTDLQLGDEACPTPDDAQRVLLTTIHGAKGGEWRVVFVTGWEEGLLPHARSLTAQPSRDSGVEEELRVAFVAVTRPRDRLYLTCCRNRQRGERSEPQQPSRFLRRLPVDKTEQAA